MFGLSFQELLIVGIVAVLLFGKRLPEVAKSLGQSYNQFRKGLADLHSSIDYTSTSSYSPRSSSTSRRSYEDYDDYEEPTAPKFEPPANILTPETAPSETNPPTGDISKPISER